MNLTNEVLEMWEADARRGATDVTAANARLLRLIEEDRENAGLIAQLTAWLAEVRPDFAAAIDQALLEAAPSV